MRDADTNECVACLRDGDCAARKTCVNRQCVGDTLPDAGPVEPPETGIGEAGAPSTARLAGYIEGGGCSVGSGSLASAWPILGALALLVTRKKRRP